MKKTFHLFGMIAVLSVCALCTSCTNDEDTEESIILSGQWSGNWGMYYEVENPYTGEIVAFDSYDTDIVFYPQYDYATYGYGYQVDWYRVGPYSKMSFRFNWSISNGVIHLTYPGYPEYNTSIRNYSMNNTYFKGFFTNATEPFCLYKIADYYNWSYYYDYGDYYYWRYDAWSWGDYYYAPTRAEAAGAAPAKAAPESKEPRIVKIGSRLAER